MSKESAAKFLIACENDQEIEKALREIKDEKGNPFEAMAEVAAKLGYEASASEIAQAFAERAATDRSALKNMEYSLEEMDQIAGGKGRPECSSDFDVNSRCAFNDQCLNAWHYYKRNSACKSTYRSCTYEEDCVFNDECIETVRDYDINDPNSVQYW